MEMKLPKNHGKYQLLTNPEAILSRRNSEQIHCYSRKNLSKFFLVPLFSFLIFSLVSCDLFVGPKVDLFKQISNEVDWANAEKLTVTVYTGEWGRSPQEGQDKCGDIRKGYEFGVEFTPLSVYGFEKWLAFPTAGFAEWIEANKNKSSYDEDVISHALNGKNVTIIEGVSDTGARTAKVIIDTLESVTIVPWCNSRPRLTQQTNPPLNPILTPFPYDQQVSIWFNIPVKSSTLTYDNIRITGIYTSGNDRGKPFNETGDLSTYFTIDIPNSDTDGLTNRLNLIPIAQKAKELILLSISIIIGPDIESENGATMAQAETISYQTDTREMQKVYKAVNIFASRNSASDYFTDTDWNNPNKDRRFKQDDKNTVYIRFNVDAPYGDDIPLTPNRISIVEHKAYDLDGFDAGGTIKKEYSYPGDNVTFQLQGGVFTITHTLQTATSGIIQLLVLPWYEGTPSIAEMQVTEAASEGLYVTVVLDNAAPNILNMVTILSTPSSGGGDAVYVYGTGTPLTLTIGNLASIIDNGGSGGISASRAYSLPWTMDDPKDLKWQIQITRTDENAGVPITSELLNVYNGETLNNSYTWPNLSGLIQDITYRIDIQLEDRLGNKNPIDTKKQVMYSTLTKRTVTKLKAECNAKGDKITVSWEQPLKADNVSPDYLYPELVIYRYRTSASGDIFENEISYDFNKEPAGSYDFSVSTINKDRVLEGVAVSGVYGYRIIVITHNTAGPVTTGPIWIYNIPDMKVSESYWITDGDKIYKPVVRITENTGQLTIDSDSWGDNIVLTRDITLGSHKPIYYFSGNFYGNGHTITMNNGFSNYRNNVGIFDSAQNALICDLDVAYKDTVVTVEGNQNYVGGIAGKIRENSEVRNCIVRSIAASDILTVTTQNTTWLGGIAGIIESSTTACIKNCRAALNVTLNAYTHDTIYVGSVVGASNANSNIDDSIKFTDIRSTAVVSMNKIENKIEDPIHEHSQWNYCGGIAGFIKNTNFTRCVFNGKIDIPKTSKVLNYSYIGGLLGTCYEKATIDDCSVTGDIIICTSGTGQIMLGGVISSMQKSDNPSSFFKITNTNYSEGEIQLFDFSGDSEGSTPNPHFVGGFIASIDNSNNYIENCHSSAKSITFQANKIESIRSINLGGFAGEIAGNISNCYSTSPIIVPASHVGTGVVLVGGFCGCVCPRDVGSRIENCFATGIVTVYCSSTGSGGYANEIGGFAGLASNQYINNDINVISKCYSTGDILAINHCDMSGVIFGFNVGGLVGRAEGTDISESYATGNVTARKGSGGTMTVIAGGLVGFLGTDNNYHPSFRKSSIVDCYATGNVTADNPNADNASVYAGGLVGYMQVAYSASPLTGIVTRSFASGTVIAKNASSGASAWAGGIVGYKASGNLQQCVAAGRPGQPVSVSAQGGNNRYVGRIYGQSAGTAPANNYANAAILTGKGAGNGTDADGYYTNPTLTVVTDTPTAASENGATATNSQLSTSSFWTSALLSFNSTKWNFAPVSQGWPVLINVGGNQ